MNRLSTEKRVQILYALCEGASVNATARQTGASKVTILKLLADVGTAALDYQRKTLVNLPCTKIQADEIWSFVGCKEKNVPRDEKGRGRGDAWTWTAICADTKLIPCWHVGLCDADAAHLFMEDLASRLAHRVQLTTDGHRPYLTAVESAFGWSQIDYAMLVKLYGAAHTADPRSGAQELVGIAKTRIMGKPDVEHISTSYVESQNTRMRTNIRRLTRLTNGHSKKLENHIHAMALWFMYYNFCRPHMTLTKQAGGIKRTPAMAAGVADHVWKLDEVVALLNRSN
ncbi:MAG: IS1 family transposase [Gemmatimonadaceae bacterium]